MDEAQTAESDIACTDTANVGKLKLERVTHDHLLDLSPAVDERSDLPTHLAREFGEVASELRAGHLTGTYSPPEGGLQALQLVWLEPQSISADGRNGRSP
jgi:hypothetical protein